MAIRIVRKLRDLLDVKFETFVDGDRVTYRASDDSFVGMAASGGGSVDAVDVAVTPAGNIAATDVQAALQELDTEKASQASLDAHLTDAVDAHDASAISFSPTGTISATDVQSAIAEVATEAGGTGAPTTADYLVGTAQGGLSAEIVVGTSPGGELGGTWGSPTVDATHSGSSHSSIQSAAEATAAAALAAHEADTTNIHGITNTANLQPLDSDLTAIAALTTTTFGRSLLELANSAALLSAAGAQASDSDLTAIAALTPTNDDVIQRKAGAWTNRTIAQLLTDLAAAGTTFQPLDSDLTAIAALTTTTFGRALLTEASAATIRATLDLEAGTDFPSLTTFNAHLTDTTDAHDASAISFAPVGSIAATDVQAAIAEVAAEAGSSSPALVDLTDVTGQPPNTGEAPVWDGDSFELIDIATQAEVDDVANDLATHTGATTSVHGITDTSALALSANVQPLDSDLTAIAGLSPTNDDVLQRKSGAWANRTLAQLMTDLAALGTTFQPLDSDLTAFAGLAIAADKLPYGNGSHTLTLADFTAAGRALLDDADASAQLTTLGVSTFIKTLLDDADAATARATIGAAASGGTKRVPVTLSIPDASGNGYSALLSTANIRQLLPGFLKDVDGSWYGSVRVPADYSSGPKLIVRILCSTTSGVSRLNVHTSAFTDAETVDAALTAETAQDITVPATAYKFKDVSFTLASSPAAGDTLTVRVQHAGDHANDTLTVDTLVYDVCFEYTAA